MPTTALRIAFKILMMILLLTELAPEVSAQRGGRGSSGGSRASSGGGSRSGGSVRSSGGSSRSSGSIRSSGGRSSSFGSSFGRSSGSRSSLGGRSSIGSGSARSGGSTYIPGRSGGTSYVPPSSGSSSGRTIYTPPSRTSTAGSSLVTSGSTAGSRLYGSRLGTPTTTDSTRTPSFGVDTTSGSAGRTLGGVASDGAIDSGSVRFLDSDATAPARHTPFPRAYTGGGSSTSGSIYGRRGATTTGSLVVDRYRRGVSNPAAETATGLSTGRLSTGTAARLGSPGRSTSVGEVGSLLDRYGRTALERADGNDSLARIRSGELATRTGRPLRNLDDYRAGPRGRSTVEGRDAAQAATVLRSGDAVSTGPSARIPNGAAGDTLGDSQLQRGPVRGEGGSQAPGGNTGQNGNGGNVPGDDDYGEWDHDHDHHYWHHPYYYGSYFGQFNHGFGFFNNGFGFFNGGFGFYWNSPFHYYPWYWFTPNYFGNYYPWYWFYNHAYYPNNLGTTIIYDSSPDVVYVEPEVIYLDSGVPAGEAVAPAPQPEGLPQVAGDEALNTAAQRYLDLGDAAFREGKYGDAVQFYAKAIQMGPESGVLYLVLSDALFATGDYHYAAFAIRQAFQLDPALVSTGIDKHGFYTDPSEFDRQLATLERYVEDHPGDGDALLVLATNYLFGNRPAAAVDALKGPFASSLGADSASALILQRAEEAQYGEPVETP